MPILPKLWGVCCLVLLLTTPLRAQQLIKTLHLGESEVYPFDRMTTAAVGSPLVADIVPLSAHRLLVNAKSLGETTLIVCDKRGIHRWRLSVVAVPPDLGPVAAQVQREIGLLGVTTRIVSSTLFLEGTVPNSLALQRASAIAGVYAPGFKNLLTVSGNIGGAASLAQTYAALLTPALASLGITVQIIDDKTLALSGQYAASNSLASTSPETKSADSADGGMDLSENSKSRTVESSGQDPLARLVQSLPADLKIVDMLNLGRRPTRQILVHAKVIDIDRSATKTLGLQWGGLNIGTARQGNTYSFQSQPILFGQVGGGLSSDPAGGGTLSRILPLAAQLNALILENKARVLSEPSLMVLDGSEGIILVGGEIPIPVAQASSGTGGVNSSITVAYKPYGVRLSVRASLIGTSTVGLTVTPEVSSLDYGNAVQISGFSIPALTVRRATSTLQMENGETLVIGGLYSSTESRQVERIPLLSQIPVLGEFFKNTSTHKEESELMILIEPEIVGPGTPGATPPPLGSPENLPIPKPAVGPSDFDQDFPELQHHAEDSAKGQESR